MPLAPSLRQPDVEKGPHHTGAGLQGKTGAGAPWRCLSVQVRACRKSPCRRGGLAFEIHGDDGVEGGLPRLLPGIRLFRLALLARLGSAQRGLSSGAQGHGLAARGQGPGGNGAMLEHVGCALHGHGNRGTAFARLVVGRPEEDHLVAVGREDAHFRGHVAVVGALEEPVLHRRGRRETSHPLHVRHVDHDAHVDGLSPGLFPGNHAGGGVSSPPLMFQFSFAQSRLTWSLRSSFLSA